MKTVMSSFPNCMIVFSTLKKMLTAKEKKLILTLANKCRRNLKAGKPSHYIIILTANELYASYRLYKEYEKLGERYINFVKRIMYADSILEELSDITQQLYLNLEPWDTFLQRRYKIKLPPEQINRKP